MNRLTHLYASTLSAFVDTSYFPETRGCEGCGAPKLGNECSYCGAGKRVEHRVKVPETHVVVARAKPSIWRRLFG